jgi:hypothetical protein
MNTEPPLTAGFCIFFRRLHAYRVGLVRLSELPPEEVFDGWIYRRQRQTRRLIVNSTTILSVVNLTNMVCAAFLLTTKRSCTRRIG